MFVPDKYRRSSIAVSALLSIILCRLDEMTPCDIIGTV